MEIQAPEDWTTSGMTRMAEQVWSGGTDQVYRRAMAELVDIAPSPATSFSLQDDPATRRVWHTDRRWTHKLVSRLHMAPFLAHPKAPFHQLGFEL